MSKKDQKLETGNKKPASAEAVADKQETNEPPTMNNDQPTTNGGESVEIKEVIKEINTDYRDKWLRAQADYQNLVKETEARRSEWVRYSEQQILGEFIPVYDNFKKAFSMEHGTWNMEQESWVKGIELIMKQFGDVLKQHGVEEIKTVGEEFNPELHEAVGDEKSEEFKSGVVVREVEAGYMMKRKVVKAAKVIISK